MNPLADFCRKMGVSYTTAAEIAKVDTEAARLALLDEPPAAVRAYIAIAEAIDAKLRLTKAEPIRFWIDLAAVDQLYSSDRYRYDRKLPLLPPTRGKLREWIRQMRRQDKSLLEITEILERGYICTSEGLATWRKSTLHLMCEATGGNRITEQFPLIPGNEATQRWRDFVMNDLLASAAPQDGMLAVRYGMQRRIEAGKVYFWTTKPIPTAPRKWFMAGLARVWWLEGKWGESELETAQVGAEHAAQGVGELAEKGE